MDKKNEKTAQTNEMMELTLDQMDKVFAGGVPEIMAFTGERDPFDDSRDKDDPWKQN